MSKIVIHAIITVPLDDPQPQVWVPINKAGKAVGCVVETPNGGFFSADYGAVEDPAQYARTLFVDQCQFNVHVTDVEEHVSPSAHAEALPITNID